MWVCNHIVEFFSVAYRPVCVKTIFFFQKPAKRCTKSALFIWSKHLKKYRKAADIVLKYVNEKLCNKVAFDKKASYKKGYEVANSAVTFEKFRVTSNLIVSILNNIWPKCNWWNSCLHWQIPSLKMWLAFVIYLKVSKLTRWQIN